LCCSALCSSDILLDRIKVERTVTDSAQSKIMISYQTKRLEKRVLKILKFYECQRLKCCQNYDVDGLKKLIIRIQRECAMMEKQLQGYALSNVLDFFQLHCQIEAMRIKRHLKHMLPLINLLCKLPT